MKQTARDSLRGQNECRRVAGVGSSPILSPSQKTRLWQRLRKYDRQIAKIDERSRWEYYFVEKKDIPKLKKKRSDLDEKRKNVRRQLKGYVS